MAGVLRSSCRSPVVLHGADEHHLHQGDGDQRQRVVHDAEGHREVVERAAVQHLRARLEPGAALNARAVGLMHIEISSASELAACAQDFFEIQLLIKSA